MGDDELKETKYFQVRKFLNKPGFHSVAAIHGHVIGEDWDYINSEIMVSDCRKTITLDFNASNRDQARNALHKARLLANTFGEVAAAIELAMKTYARGKPE